MLQKRVLSIIFGIVIVDFRKHYKIGVSLLTYEDSLKEDKLLPIHLHLQILESVRGTPEDLQDISSLLMSFGNRSTYWPSSWPEFQIFV